MNAFRQDPAKTNMVVHRQSAAGESLALGVPIKIGNSSCLTCHSTPDKAPPEMIKTYGGANGFGWKMDEVIGAQIVSVPASLPLEIANRAFEAIAVWLVGIFAAVFVLVNFAVAILTPSAPRSRPARSCVDSRMSSILLKNGRIIDPANGRDEIGDIWIREGKIAQAPAGARKAGDTETIDCTGLVIAPGLIDIHVHFREPGQSAKETIASAHRAAPRRAVSRQSCACRILRRPSTIPASSP